MSILSFSNRREEALATHQELARRMGEETPEYHELIEHSLLEKADFELVCGKHTSALKTVDQVLALMLSGIVGKPVVGLFHPRKSDSSPVATYPDVSGT